MPNVAPPARFPTATAQAPELRPTTVRGAMADHGDPLPVTPITLPSPDALGLARVLRAPAEPRVDWEAARKQLRDLGAVQFQCEQLPEGGCRFVCQLATTELGRSHSIEARAGTEAEAIRQVLARAEQWRRAN
jgi:hypothetical protein